MNRRNERGVTLVELLVTTVISLIAVVAIFQSFATFEGYKRTTMAGGEAQNNGSLALQQVERDVRQAGYGFSAGKLGCKILAWDEEDNGGTTFEIIMVPILIKAGNGENGSDDVIVLYGDGNLTPTPATMIQSMPSPSADYKVDNRFPFREGDLVVAVQDGKDCTLSQISNLPNGGNQNANIVHGSGTYTDPWKGMQMRTRYNKPSGLGVAYDQGAQLYSLGDAPTSNTYYVEDSQLKLQENLRTSGTGFIPSEQQGIYPNIVHMRAMYGKDTDGDGIVDVYDNIDPVTAEGWTRILSVRLGLVARSAIFEKNIVSPATINIWSESTIAPIIDAAVWNINTEQQHYRYKVYQVTVPVRNMIWR